MINIWLSNHATAGVWKYLVLGLECRLGSTQSAYSKPNGVVGIMLQSCFDTQETQYECITGCIAKNIREINIIKKTRITIIAVSLPFKGSGIEYIISSSRCCSCWILFFNHWSETLWSNFCQYWRYRSTKLVLFISSINCAYLSKLGISCSGVQVPVPKSKQMKSSVATWPLSTRWRRQQGTIVCEHWKYTIKLIKFYITT